MKTPVPNPQKADFPDLPENGLLWLHLVHQYSRDIKSVTTTFNPDSLAASTTREESITVSGIKTGDIILAISKPTHTSNYIVGGSAYVSAADTVKVSVSNPHPSSAADPGSETWRITYLKNTRI